MQSYTISADLWCEIRYVKAAMMGCLWCTKNLTKGSCNRRPPYTRAIAGVLSVTLTRAWQPYTVDRCTLNFKRSHYRGNMPKIALAQTSIGLSKVFWGSALYPTTPARLLSCLSTSPPLYENYSATIGVVYRAGRDSRWCECDRVVRHAWRGCQQLRPWRQYGATTCWIQPQTCMLTQVSTELASCINNVNRSRTSRPVSRKLLINR